MQKEEISPNQINYPFSQAFPFGKSLMGTNQSANSITHHINLLDLNQYRIKNFCHYDPTLVNTTDYSIFQIEILNDDLQRFYQGRFILEVWTKSGDRIFQKILKEEVTQWKVYNNTFIFKGANDSPLIYVLWLQDRKMIAIKHPYEDNKEVDIMLFDNYLIVAQQFNFRFVQLNPTEITTTISQFMNPDEPAKHIEREFSGIIQNDKIFGLLPNPSRHELLFICVSDNHQLIYYKFQVNRQTEKRQVSLIKVDQDAKPKKSKLDKRQSKLLEAPSEVQQIQLIMKGTVPFLLVLRKNQVLEVIESFSQSVYAEQRPNLTRILPSFGERITLQFGDGSITQTQSLDKIQEKSFLSEVELNKQHMLPPKYTVLSEIQKNIHFYQDALVVNQSLFLLRDNVIFIIDTFTRQILARYHQKQKIVSMHKLKFQTDDENGYKVTTYKIVAVHRNGTLQVFVPNDNNLMSDWVRTEINQTSMLQNKEVVLSCFQNQAANNYLYIITATGQNDVQKLYQMMYNTQIIELNLKFKKGDYVFSVNSVSRQREMIGTLDPKYVIIYRNDKGNLIKLYQLNHTRLDLKDQINANSIFYFQKEYINIITKNIVYKINAATSAIEQTLLSDPLKQGGSCLVDSQCFYFLTAGDEEGHTKISIADNSMIQASFSEANREEANNAIVDKDKSKTQAKLLHPSWNFPNNARRLDFDEFNSVFNIQLANYEIVQVPLLHRNTMHFMGMAERTFYLAFKKNQDYFYALDKSNHVNCWSMTNGQMLWRTPVDTGDYKLYDLDRNLYDRGWFQQTLIYKSNDASPNGTSSADDLSAVQYRTYKIIEINEKCGITETLTFVHPVQKNMEQHLYFNTQHNQMIEVLLNKSKGGQATYNLYQLENILNQKWKFVSTLNSSDTFGSSFEWHTKTLYPYTINQRTLNQVSQESFKVYDTYKVLDKDRVKILNTQDGIEMIWNIEQQKLESYMALQYSFANTKDSFYDKKCGHFFVQEITSRLQNYYEQVRRGIFLKSKNQIKQRSLDVSAKDFKYKYVIEQGYTVLDYQFFRQYIKENMKGLLKTLKRLSSDQVQRLVHNIFPDGNNTLLHYIAESEVGFESVDYLSQLAKKEGFVIPFLINEKLLTPLDLTVTKRDFKQTNSLVKMLSKTPMDHHSRLIPHLIPKLIEMNLSSLEKYFDRRKFSTGVCKSITLGKINIDPDQDYIATPTNLVNDNSENVNKALMKPKVKEQSINLEVLDIPLSENKSDYEPIAGGAGLNDYEIRVVKSLAGTDNLEIFQQKSVRAFIDYVWPQSRWLIFINLFLPYLAFIVYYLTYLIMIKKLSITQQQDPTFFRYTAGMFNIFDLMFKIILFLGCFYFFYQDFLQIQNLPNNSIVLWSYANIIPLILIIFIIIYDLVLNANTQFEQFFYSASSFFIWIRVVHMLKVFPQTSYLLRMGSEMLYRMRYLICFIIVSLLAFGFTYYFVADPDAINHSQTDSPAHSVAYMFEVLLGQYDIASFNNVYLQILLLIVSFFNFFFIFTMLIALSIISFSKDSDIYSNEAYQDKASLIALYSYLMTQKAVREPSKKYLLIATVTETRKGKGHSSSSGFIGGSGSGSSDPKGMQAKMLKTMDRRLNNLTNKVEKTLKDIQDKLESVANSQQRDN